MDVNKSQKRVFSFLEQMAKETNVSKGKARFEQVRQNNKWKVKIYPAREK